MSALSRRPLGDILISKGLVSYLDIERALSKQTSSHKKLGELLMDEGLITEEQVTEARAEQLDVTYISLLENQFDQAMLGLITEPVARAYRLIPVQQIAGRLVVAMVNPLDVEAIDMIQFETKFRVEAALATEWRVIDAINRNYGSTTTEDLQGYVDDASTEAEEALLDTAPEMIDEIAEGLDEMRRQSHQAPVVRMVNALLTQAVRKRASDIHIEPQRNHTEVRYRVDGELQLAKRIPKSLQSSVASRLKIMSDLDISERRLPQDGRIAVRIDGRSVDMRVSTSPVIHGERLVLRILDRTRGLLPVESLGFSDQDLERFRSLITRPYGIILVTGPTGSGKTTTLYAALNTLKNEQTNIMTVEDPVEYEIEGINQTNVHHRIGLTFALQLRAILRQDPDIVLVGEIRDAETADVAFRAALTGHLVLSTLHCNDAPGSVTRLLDMDVEPFLVSTAIVGVLAQRLVRVLCPDCKAPYQADDTEKAILGVLPDNDCVLYHPVGCANCDNTGYRGRTAIRELMPITSEIRKLALTKSSATEIRGAAIAAGMTPMRDDGIAKALAGVTTLEEVERKVFLESDSLDSPTQSEHTA